MIFNYKRVSTIIQSTERQLLDIECDREYEDKLSGKNRERPQLEAMLLNIRGGDTINVHSMDRLARNTKDLLNIVEEITNKGAKIMFHKENLTFAPDKNDPYQELMMTMLAAVSTLERELINQRVREGVAIAKAKGKFKGGKNKLSSEQVEELNALYTKGIKIAEIARKFGLSRPTVYSYIKK
ncbi:MAG: recombinase family protein [Alphaproteobacteria bacterium]